MHPKAFLNKVMEEAQQYSDIVNPSASAAHAAVESSWGESGLTVQANNLFGLKCGSRWSGPVWELPTQEETPQGMVIVHARFRKYLSWEESVKDYARLTERLYPYAVKGRKSACGFLSGLFLTGPLSWATDSRAFHKAMGIVEDYSLEADLETPTGTWRLDMLIDHRPLIERLVGAFSGTSLGRLRLTGPRSAADGQAVKFDVNRENWD